MSFSPARAHRAKIAAEQAAKQQADEVVYSDEYSLMLANLDQQRRSLKSVQSRETRQAMKAEYLQEWQTYIDATLAENSGALDTIISRLWIWLLDVGQMDSAINVGRYLIEHELPPPEGFNRTTATTFAEEIAEAWLQRQSSSEPVSSDDLLSVMSITAEQDMPDEVRAKLHRAVGESLAQDKPADAVLHLARALELNPKVGCRKQHDTLAKQLATEPNEPA